jgi:hypothetical protein
MIVFFLIHHHFTLQWWFAFQILKLKAVSLMSFHITLSILLHKIYNITDHLMLSKTIKNESGEVQIILNQKIDSKLSKIIDFASRFVLLIKSKFKIRTLNNHYKSQCKINGYKRFEPIFWFKVFWTSPPPKKIWMNEINLSYFFMLPVSTSSYLLLKKSFVVFFGHMFF